MKKISALVNSQEKIKQAVIAIGVFDGLHRGHRHLIRSALSTARQTGRPLVCVTFHPHPKGAPYLISLRHRLKLIGDLGVTFCLVVHFNEKFAKIKPYDFVKNTIVRIFNPSFIFIGDKFRFGYKAQGDVGLLKSYASEFDFKVKAITELKIGKRIISSNVIRALIKRGNLKEAEKFLGRKVSVLGTVTTGFKVGRLLGYPTANINPHHEVLPHSGVYAVKIVYPIKNCPEPVENYYGENAFVSTLKDRGKVRFYNGMCYIGRKPTFGNNRSDTVVEAHIFDFKRNIYGEDIEIQFVRRLRPERKFPSRYHLVSQINKDRKQALQILNSSH